MQAAAGKVRIRLTATLHADRGGQTVAPGVRRFPIQGSPTSPQVVDVFPGGCVTYHPEVGIGPSAPLLDQAQRAVTYRTRDALREASDAAPAADSSLTPKTAVSTAIGQHTFKTCSWADGPRNPAVLTCGLRSPALIACSGVILSHSTRRYWTEPDRTDQKAAQPELPRPYWTASDDGSHLLNSGSLMPPAGGS